MRQTSIVTTLIGLGIMVALMLMGLWSQGLVFV